jgi:hypothetical protein
MKHTMTNLEATDEPYSSKFLILGNYALNSYFGNFVAKSLLILKNQQSKIILQENIFQEAQCNIIDVNTIDKTNLVVDINIWTLFFDGSKSQEGA